MSGPRRREFIPKLRAMIADACPFPAETVNDAIDHWRDGDSPRHPIDQGVFAMCDHVAGDLDKADAKAEAEPDPDACTNPGGHEWNRTAGEADEARIRGDVANDSIRCVHCGADGDA